MAKPVYPIGIQTFSEIVRHGMAYVDKTRFVYDLASRSKYVFLNRPRRFGKSLLVSTFESYFRGKKELFRGLDLERLERDWKKYPVFLFDLGKTHYESPEQLRTGINLMLLDLEAVYGSREAEVEPSQRLEGAIRRAFEMTGHQVVVLIDEYDSPLLDVIDRETFEGIQEVLRDFYSPLKSCDRFLRFVFITGITKFSQVSIFSELNNLRVIGMTPEFNAICGITEKELREELPDGVRSFAEANGLTFEGAVRKLKENYDGYHFSRDPVGIYNPFSLLSALADRAANPYWFSTGTPTALLKMLKKYQVPADRLAGKWLSASKFDAPAREASTPSPFLFQSGYLTIKKYDPETDLYLLDLPNREVSAGFWDALIPFYLSPEGSEEAPTVVAKFWRGLASGDPDAALACIKEFLGTVPYARGTNTEGHCQILLYVIFKMLGKFADTEVRTARGRVDLVVYEPRTVYVIEVKLDQSAGAALRQIDEMGYGDRFAQLGRKVVRVGVSFSSSSRTLEKWLIEE